MSNLLHMHGIEEDARPDDMPPVDDEEDDDVSPAGKHTIQSQAGLNKKEGKSIPKVISMKLSQHLVFHNLQATPHAVCCVACFTDHAQHTATSVLQFCCQCANQRSDRHNVQRWQNSLFM